MRRQLVIGIGVAAILMAGAAAAPLYRWLAEDRKAREQVRQARIQQSLARLTAANPGAYYARYPPDGEPVLFGASFSTCAVPRVVFARHGGSVRVSLVLVGTRPWRTAPTVYVSIYDENGARIGRSAIVNYRWPHLGRMDRLLVDDRLNIRRGTDPAIASLDEGDAGQVGEARQ